MSKFKIGDIVTVYDDVSVTFGGCSGKIVDVDDPWGDNIPEYCIEFDEPHLNVLHKFYFTEDELES